MHGSSSGEVWFAVRGRGLAVLDNDEWRFVTTDDGLVSNDVTSMSEFEGKLWAAGRGGYSVLEDSGWRAVPEVGGRRAAIVFSLTPSADGKALWFGARGFAARLEAATWTHMGVADSLPHTIVHQALTDRDGVTWFACRRGLGRLKDGIVSVFHPELNFRSIVEDNTGRLWFGTGGSGIFSYGDGKWERHLEGKTVLPSFVDARN